MTKLILCVMLAGAANACRVLSSGEPAAMWLINLGLLVFLRLKISSDIRLGAIVMDVEVLLGVGTTVARLRAAPAISAGAAAPLALPRQAVPPAVAAGSMASNREPAPRPMRRWPVSLTSGAARLFRQPLPDDGGRRVHRKGDISHVTGRAWQRIYSLGWASVGQPVDHEEEL